MNDFLSLLPQTILAQALGVFLACRVDAATWKWRDDEEFIASLNILSVCLLFPWVLVWIGVGLSERHLFLFAASSFFWLLLSTEVQHRQTRRRFSAAFSRTWMQWACFVALIAAGAFGWLAWLRGVNFVIFVVWLVSVTLTYALLSLFRPTIYSAWNSFRRYAGKNRRVR